MEGIIAALWCCGEDVFDNDNGASCSKDAADVAAVDGGVAMLEFIGNGHVEAQFRYMSLVVMRTSSQTLKIHS